MQPMTITRPARPRGSLPQLLAMEWTKLRSLRSNVWILLLGGLAAVGLAAATAQQVRSGVDPAEMARLDSGTIVEIASVGPNLVTVMFIIAFGALTITGEYSSRMIHTTLTAAPQRGRLLAAKTVVLAAVTWGYGAVLAGTCWVLAGLILPGGFGGAGAGTAVQLVAATATWLAIVALFTCGLGTVLRSTAGAVAASFGLIVVLPVVAPLVGEHAARIVPYTLQEAAFVMITGEGGNAPAAYGPLVAVLVLAAWAAAALTAGYATLKRRDA